MRLKDNIMKFKEFISMYFEDSNSAPSKYSHINFKPPTGVAAAAEQGLKYRREAKPSNKGGLSVQQASKFGIGSGVQRAVNLKNRDTMSPETVRRMKSFFDRHSVYIKNHDKQNPNRSYISFLLWGGDSGRSWANKVVAQMNAADEKEKRK